MSGENPVAPPRPERTHRLFFALWPSEALRAALAPCIRALQPAGVGRPQRPDQWHVTLEFLGSVPASRVAAARDAAAQVRASPGRIAVRRGRVLAPAGGAVSRGARVAAAARRRWWHNCGPALAAQGFEPETAAVPGPPHAGAQGHASGAAGAVRTAALAGHGVRAGRVDHRPLGVDLHAARVLAAARLTPGRAAWLTP